jgi:twitching motility two-component system response regulator PilH
MIEASDAWQPLVLIVDDSPTHVAFTRQCLARAGYRVSVAATGQQALELARELGPDLLLMDVVMPDMNGYQATRKLSRSPITGHIPIILASSKGQESDRVWGMRQGAVDYLIKPLEETQLLGRVRHALQRAAASAATSRLADSAAKTN